MTPRNEREGSGRSTRLSRLGTAGPRPGRYRVLLLDADGRQSLAACRALGRSRYEVGVCVGDGDRLASYSRYATRSHGLPDPRGDAFNFRSALEAIVHDYSYDVVVAMHDWTLGRLCNLDRPLSVPSFPLIGRSVELLADKLALAALCEEVVAAYPKTALLTRDVESVAAVDTVGGPPVVVKAARSAEPTRERVAYRRGATVAANAQAAGVAANALREEGLVPIVQARIDAVEKLNAAVLRRDGRSELRYAHRVLREVPITGGVGVTLETIDPNTGTGGEAVAVLERICEAVGHVGIAQAEMYRARTDGRLYVVDVNPRLWGSTWFAERLGLRVVDRGVRLALGLPAWHSPDYAYGRRYHYLQGEFRWLLSCDRARDGLRELVRTTRPWDVFEADQISDPTPLLGWALASLTSMIKQG